MTSLSKCNGRSLPQTVAWQPVRVCCRAGESQASAAALLLRKKLRRDNDPAARAATFFILAFTTARDQQQSVCLIYFAGQRSFCRLCSRCQCRTHFNVVILLPSLVRIVFEIFILAFSRPLIGLRFAALVAQFSLTLFSRRHGLHLITHH